MTIRTLALAGAALLAFAAPAFASTVVAKPVHVLAGPGTNFSALFDLATNSKVNVMWCGPKGFAWCLVSYHRQQGWVLMSSLTTVNANGTPVVDTPNNGGPTPAKPDDPDDKAIAVLEPAGPAPKPHIELNPVLVQKVTKF